GIIAEKVVFLKEADKDNVIFQATLSKNEKIIVGDIFACKILAKKNRPQNVFFNLVKNGIIFQSVNEKDYYNYYDAITSITPAKEKVILDSMVADIKYVGKYYSKDKASFPIIEKGKYKDKNVLDAMLMATPAEVYNFFRFVEENSTPYLANTWKISETYATWLVNGAIAPLKPDELRLQIISAKNNEELKEKISQNKITAEFLAELDAQADKLNEAGKYDEASRLVEKIIFIAKEKNLLEPLAEAYWTKAAIESNKYNWEQVAAAYEAAAQIYMLDENPLMASVSLNNLGDTYNELGNYDKAEGILKRAFKMQTDFLAKNKNENVKTVMQPYVGLTLRNLGDSYFNMSKFQEALNSYQQAVGYFEKVAETDQKNLGRKANTYSRIAKTYNKLGNTPKRNETLQEAIKMGEKLESKLFLAEIYKITAGMYNDSREYSNARIYYEKTLETYQKLGNKGEQVYALANLANMVSLLDNDFAKAEQLVGQALKLAQEVKDEHAISFCYRRIGDFQLNNGNPQKA
ncbi:MAG: tetratricopeptide repeat protein, partial [Raineya sp.]